MLAATGASAVMVGRGAQGNPWALREIVFGETQQPSREEVAAELIHFIRETVRELGERRGSSFLKKFYGWYLGHGRFPKPFKNELMQLSSTEEVVTRLLAAAPGAADLLARSRRMLPDETRSSSRACRSRSTAAAEAPAGARARGREPHVPALASRAGAVCGRFPPLARG